MNLRGDGAAKIALLLLAAAAAAAYAVFLVLVQGVDLGSGDWGSQPYVNAVLCLVLAVLLTACMPVMAWNMRIHPAGRPRGDGVVCYRKVKDGKTGPRPSEEEPETKGKMPRP
jgi:hypothetical protein